ncbi:hypothetical protein BGZ63DRAFT_55618 [Mariannaea sp. PMI_226]|nr:hypothetical protein BGZ63DRAFT_55618 [Mariannaea sp. PMI_226]
MVTACLPTYCNLLRSVACSLYSLRVCLGKASLCPIQCTSKHRPMLEKQPPTKPLLMTKSHVVDSKLHVQHEHGIILHTSFYYLVARKQTTYTLEPTLAAPVRHLTSPLLVSTGGSCSFAGAFEAFNALRTRPSYSSIHQTQILFSIPPHHPTLINRSHLTRILTTVQPDFDGWAWCPKHPQFQRA